MATVDRRTAAIAFCGSLVLGATAVTLLSGEGVGRQRAPSRGRGAWTSFGTVAVLGTHRHGSAETATQHTHEGGHEVWSDTVMAAVEIHNGSDRAILVSPGQFRLRVGSTGPTVSYYDSDRAPGVLEAGRTLRMWVSYLAPATGDLVLEYAEPGAAAPLTAAIGSASRQVTS